eukprot:m.33182 g.33182  ORF g.33182 m.33182 type:complete len:347 (+) comp31765_c0_seq1:2-1042(+)
MNTQETNALLPTSRRKRARKPFRLIAKDGSSLVENEKVRKKALMYLRDGFTTFVHLQWAYVLLLSSLTYVVTWFAFALLWWIASTMTDSSGGPCIIKVSNFTSSFLFSVETQTTVGFGDLYISSGCRFGVFLLVLQSCLGVILDSFIIGILFTKLARPRERGQTVLFSQNAVISRNPETDRFCLQCRVGDVRKSHILEAHVRGMLFRFIGNTGNRRKEVPLQIETLDLDVGYDQGFDRLFLLFPVIVEHEINESSPLYNMTPFDLSQANIEIVFNLEGTMEATGMLTHKLTSYLPDEIYWGRKFCPLTYAYKGRAAADFSKLGETVLDEGTPHCSPKEYAERQRDS